MTPFARYDTVTVVVPVLAAVNIKVEIEALTASRVPSKVTDALPLAPAVAVMPVNDTVFPAGTDTVTVTVSPLSKCDGTIGSPAPRLSTRDALPVVAVLPATL